jgi:hypothetical protein
VPLQEWQRSVWSAAERTTRQNAEAAQSVGRNLGEWASNLGRALQGAEYQLDQLSSGCSVACYETFL